MTRGRRRSRAKKYPPGITPDKLPTGAYWDKSRRHWYTVYKDQETGRQRRRRIADADAKLSDLHREMESFRASMPAAENQDCLPWIAKQFIASPQYKRLAKATRDDYSKHEKIAFAYPSKKRGLTMGDAPLAAWTTATIQKLIDNLTDERGPSTANHTLRYIRRLFSWAVRRGYVNINPAKGVEQAKERRRRRCPSPEVYGRVLAFAKAYSGYPYLWSGMELTYLCRARGIEALDLTDANEYPDGIRLERRKGSRDNITEWGPRLRAAWNALIDYRCQIWAKHKRPIPMKPSDRPLFVASDGYKLKRSSLSTAWQRMITAAIKNDIITNEERFSMHDLKRAGVTRTKGTRADKQEASGHRDPAMLDIYDMSIPTVKPTED